jgi:CheY-like chemotaxis protein
MARNIFPHQGIQTTCLLHPSQFWTLLKAVNPDLLLLAAAMMKQTSEPSFKTVIQAALVKYAGCQVSTAAAALEGLQLVQAQQPDLVLMDVSMPDMDGYQCFAQLRAEPSTAKIPVILLTARVLPRDRRQFAQMGIAGVITKPFNPFTLWQQIEKIVS